MDNILLFLENIRWQDVVDITLNSYILFRLYIVFRGTVAFRVLIGIALLWFFQRIAVFMGLIVTSWAIQGITAAAAFIIIVVFRNEIRRVFRAKNLKTILWGFSRRTVNTPVEIIAASAFKLAHQRIGALVVLPAREDLKEVVQNGRPWGGVVSEEMIASIFWPDNPVHDGAAIIQGDQVTEVGVILPLSSRRDLHFQYGTRHRAALGLAEKTDALIIVVSEERGSVVVVKGPRMQVVNRKRELLEILQEHVDATAMPLGNLRKERVEIGIAAVVSILFIIGVWFSFSRGMETLVTMEIPVEYTNRDPSMEIHATSLNDVRLHLGGSGALIKSLRPEQVKVRLDLSEAVEGLNTFTVTSEEVSLPPGIMLKRAEPPTVDVTLDIPTKKELPVQVDWVGKLPRNLILEKITLDPETVQMVGGSQMLTDMSTIYTEEVNLDDITESGTMTVNLIFDPTTLKIGPGFKDKVTVNYVVKQRPR